MGQICSRKEPGIPDWSQFPYHIRVVYLLQMEQALAKEDYKETTKWLALLCWNLDMTRETKMISNLGLVDLLQQSRFLVDSFAHDALRRIHEAMASKRNRQAIMTCRKLASYFNRFNKEGYLTPPRLTQRFFLQQNLGEIRLIGWSLMHKPAFSSMKYMLSRNRDLQKLTFNFTGLGDAEGEQLMYALLRYNSKLYYIGLKGNNLSNKFVKTLTEILKDRGNFPVLCWIELRNNDGINTLPVQLMNQFKRRWVNKFREGDFLPHSGEEGHMLKAIEAVVILNDKVRKHTQEQKKLLEESNRNSINTD